MTGLLIFTLVYLFVVCALGDFSFGELVADLLFSLIIVAGVLTTFRQPWVRFGAIALAVRQPGPHLGAAYSTRREPDHLE